ncbi:MAG: MlaD family protein [Treponema sp.]|nr:MlaD family protein [Treponema sp.]
MKFSIRFADKIVGLLVVLALAALVFVVFMIGRNQRLFVTDPMYMTKLKTTSGISKNMPVHYKGFTIGHIKNIRLSDDYSEVEVYFTIFNEYKERVKVGSLVDVESSPIGLGSTFNFYPGKGDEEIPENGLIHEKNSIEGKKIIDEGLAEIPHSNDGINNILNNANLLLSTLNGDEGTEDNPFGELLISLNAILDMITSESGAVSSILDGDGVIYRELEKSIISLAGTIQNLEQSTAVLPHNLANLSVLINQINSTIVTIQETATAVNNNPLIRGGIPERVQPGPGGANHRNLEF